MLVALLTASALAGPLPPYYRVQEPWWDRAPAPARPPQASTPPEVQPYLPAEFSAVQAVILTEWPPELDETYLPLVRAIRGAELPAVICQLEDGPGTAQATLRSEGLQDEQVYWPECALDSIWMRDYGPVFMMSSDAQRMVGDMSYLRTRPNDDDFAERMAGWIGAPAHEIPLRMEGGNLLSDGQGFCLTTDATHDNSNQTTPEGVRDALRDTAGCDELLFLEPLDGELTGHVDMFAVLLDTERAVVGRYDPTQEPLNAAILDRNAAQLEAAGFRVERMPMPPSGDLDGDFVVDFPTFLNGTFLPGPRPAWLVPTYPRLAPELQEQVLEQWRELLPDHEIVPVPSDTLITWGGAVHCIMRTAPVLQWPDACTDSYDFNDWGCAPEPAGRCASLPLDGRAWIWLAGLVMLSRRRT